MIVRVLITTDDTYVLLRYVESIRENPCDQERVIDELKNDTRITIVTVSGKEHIVSMARQIELYKGVDCPKDRYEMRNIIIDNWIKFSQD